MRVRPKRTISVHPSSGALRRGKRSACAISQLAFSLVLAVATIPAEAQQPDTQEFDTQQPDGQLADTLPPDSATDETPSVEAVQEDESDEQIIRIYPAYTDLTPVSELDAIDAELPGLHAPLLQTLDFYIRSGVQFPVGGGFFENAVQPAWTIQGGVMRPIGNWERYCCVLTGELGAALTTTNGRNTDTRGFFFTPEEGILIPLDPFAQWSLTDFRQTSVHFALGGYYHPRANLRIGFRTGVRVGRVHSELNFTPSDGLQQTVDDRVVLGLDPSLFQLINEVEDLIVTAVDDDVPADGLPDRGIISFDGEAVRDRRRQNSVRSDTFVGLFSAVGIGLTYCDVRCGYWRLGDVTIAAEVEFAHDWFEMGIRADDGLGSISTLLSISFTR